MNHPILTEDLIASSTDAYLTREADPDTAIIRTSDRSSFKRCRRKWNWESGIRENLGPVDRPSYFWIGTGGHFAMEDFHGHNYYGNPVTAFEAYCDACVKSADHHKIQVPDDYEEQRAMGVGVIAHYLDWIKERDALETVWMEDVNGNNQPCVEVKCQIEIPVPQRLLDKPGNRYKRIIYQMTLDRLVVIDGEYWILDWKFFKQFSQVPVEFNGQMTAYVWGAQAMWTVPVVGAIYHEFLKKVPPGVRMLQNGDISSAKNQSVTHTQYRDALIAKYGDVSKAPSKNILALNDFAHRENENQDPFIRRTFTTRNTQQLQAEGTQVLMEMEDMLDPDLALYTNPTKDCGWDCQFNEICLQMNRDDDWSNTLRSMSISRSEEGETWRQYLRK